jgi:hypothetical protein
MLPLFASDKKYIPSEALKEQQIKSDYKITHQKEETGVFADNMPDGLSSSLPTALFRK